MLSSNVIPMIKGPMNRINQRLMTFLENDQGIALEKTMCDFFFRQSGKKLRPALIILSAAAIDPDLNLNNPELTDLAVGIELIHNASLIHDDYIDEADSRRGQAALHRKFHPRASLLFGDLLFARAFSLLLDTQPEKSVKLLSRCVEDMCRGQLLEMDDSFRTFQSYCQMIELKTARLISTSCAVGAMHATKNEDQIESITAYGHHLGMAYQMIDDIKDQDVPLVFELDLIQQIEIHLNKACERICLLPMSDYSQNMYEIIAYFQNQLNDRPEQVIHA